MPSVDALAWFAMCTRSGTSARYLAAREMGAFLLALARRRDLSYPASDRQSIALTRTLEDGDPPPLAWTGARLPEPLKGYWFPPGRAVVRWTRGRPGPGAHLPPRAVVGAKACDLAAVAIVAKVFAEHDYQEPTFLAACDSVFVVAGDCTEPLDSCFCTLVGGRPWPTEGFDLNLSPVGDGYVVTAGSDRGREFLAENAHLLRPARDDEVGSRDARRAAVEEKVRSQNERYRTRDPWDVLVAKNEGSRVWGELSATCVECHACNFACPTCHCFLLGDGFVGDDAVRVSLWDSCFMAGHARMAGGGTPRLQLTERFRNHYLHKFRGFPENWGVTACSGCGRCVDACMGRIDKRDCLQKLETRWIPSEIPGGL